MTIYLLAMSLLLGVVLGSFLNALAYRLPRKESLMTRSHCTTCGKQITAWENIPILSWLVLRGKCSKCKEPISIQYPLIELGTGLIFAALMWAAIQIADPISNVGATLLVAAAFFTFAFVGVLVSLIDLKSMRIPTKAVWLGLLISAIFVGLYTVVTGNWERAVTAIVCALALGAVYFIIWLVKPNALGFGDVRLVTYAGFVLGFVSVGATVFGFFVPWVLAMLWLIPSLVARKRSRKDQVPFGPWIVLGTVVALTVGDIVVKWYLTLGSI